MTREKNAVQKIDTATVKKALKYCSQEECSTRCPFYKYDLVCKKVAPLMESALAIIEGEEVRINKALAEYAERIKSHYPHSPAIQKTVDIELMCMQEASI